MKLERLAGVLLHPTSLPGKYGIGDIGGEAVKFLDFLKSAEQGLWQILPLSPTGFGDSPYQSFSTFAGNTLLLSPEELVKEGYLTDFEIAQEENDGKIDYGKVIEYKEPIYRHAFECFKLNADAEQKKSYELFVEQNSYWLNSFTLFMSIKQFFIKKRKPLGVTEEYEAFKEKCRDYLTKSEIDDYYYGGAWVTWPADIMNREQDAVLEYSRMLSDEIEYHSFLQYEFFRQWAKIKSYANESGIRIIGDVPIYIAYDSADCWANKEYFLLDENGFPTEVSGVPPDYFSETGQLWGNPIYNWKKLADTGFEWWIRRIEKTHEMCDIIRLDHFRGFDTYWCVPYGEKTAVNGKWKTGPADSFFNAIKDSLGELNIIAEDLGEPAVSFVELRERFELPGMKVLQFAFAGGSKDIFLPHNYECTNFVVYTGTHDNDTTLAWYAEAPEEVRDYVRRYMNISGDDIPWDMARLAYSSIAAFAIIPMQDCLALGKEARMNTPSVASGNWQWRFKEEMLTESVHEGLRYLAQMYARTPMERE